MKKIGDGNRMRALRELRPATQDRPPLFGLTVPKNIADKFLGVSFSCYSLGNSIIFESGAKPIRSGGSLL